MAEFLTTLFVDNLPLSIRKIWVYNLFTKFGKISEVVIPNKRSKVTNQQFGFVRFFSRKDALAAINYTNGCWVWGHKLTVQIAKFVNWKKTQVNPPSQPQLQNKKQIWVVKNPTTSHVDYSQEQGNSGVKFFRGAGKAAIHHKFQSIHIQPVGNGWLLRSVVAKIRKLISPKGLEKVFLMENTPVEQVKSIGGRYVIITFPNVEIRDVTIKDNWMSIWFEEIKPWMGESAKEERFVWLSCLGMPLNGWSIPNFKLIGNLWGDFIQVDEDTLHEKSYVKGKVLIATKQIQKISGSVDLKILGSSYSVRIEEEASFRIINPDLDLFLSKRVAKDSVNEEPNKKEDRERDSRTDERELNKVLAADEVNNLVSKNTDLNSLEDMEVVEETPEDMGKCNEKELQVVNQANSSNVVLIEEGVSNHNEFIEVCPHADYFENNNTSIQATVKSAQGKKRRKNIDDILGNSKVNKWNQKGRKGNKKCVVLRSAIAAAALSASVSTEGISNRNNIILSEAQAIRQMNKIIGYKYDGEDEEVISKIAELEAQEKEGVEDKIPTLSQKS